MSYLDFEVQPIVLRADFPARVTLPSGVTLGKAKIIVTRERTYVWTAPGEPTYTAASSELVLRGTFDPPSTPNRVSTTDGTLRWVPSGDCGCGSDLKRWGPFSGARRLGQTAGAS